MIKLLKGDSKHLFILSTSGRKENAEMPILIRVKYQRALNSMGHLGGLGENYSATPTKWLQAQKWAQSQQCTEHF